LIRPIFLFGERLWAETTNTQIPQISHGGFQLRWQSFVVHECVDLFAQQKLQALQVKLLCLDPSQLSHLPAPSLLGFAAHTALGGLLDACFIVELKLSTTL
jgi:hypothetical protein